MVSLIIYMII